MSVDEPRSTGRVTPGGSRTVVLCGSVRFRDTFVRVAAELTRAGHAVLSPSFLEPGADLGAEARARLGRVHLERVAVADEVLVVDVGGYVGESTCREIAAARSRGVPVRFLEGSGESATAGGAVDGPHFAGARVGGPAARALADAGYRTLADLPHDLAELRPLHGVGPAALRRLAAARDHPAGRAASPSERVETR